MFDKDGQMKTGKTKSTLKKKIQVIVSELNCLAPHIEIVDVSALLWSLTWPSGKL